MLRVLLRILFLITNRTTRNKFMDGRLRAPELRSCVTRQVVCVVVQLEVLEVKAMSAFEGHRVTSLKIEILNYTGVSTTKSINF